MIVVTAPTGNIGGQVLRHLLAAGQKARVIVRDPARLDPQVRDQVEIIQGSHSQREIVDRAFEGADAVFWLVAADRQATSVHEAFVGFTRPAAEAMRSRNIQRVVTVSALGRNTIYADKAGYVTASLAMDDLIASTGVALRALAAGSFMDNVLRQAETIKADGVFRDTVSGDRKAPTVAARDIAAVAARLLLDPTWEGQEEIPLLGPEDLSPDDMAAIMSEVLERPIRYQQIPGEAIKDRFVGSGGSEAMAQAMLDMMTAKENGLDRGVVRTPHHAQETPTTFRRWCEEVLRNA